MISKRMQALVHALKPGTGADIGCDHAWLAIEAVKTGKASRFYACDINEGPLENAKRNIADNALEDRIIPLLQDGMQGLPEDAKNVVIAGMGGDTIVSILEKGNTAYVSQLLVSPHSRPEKVRAWLMDNGWAIRSEQIVEEDGHFYRILDCRPGPMDLDEAGLLYGVNLVRDETAKKAISMEMAKLESLQERAPALKHRLALLKTIADGQ